MNVFVISNDVRICDPASAPAQRMRDLGSALDSLTIAVLGRNGTPVSLSPTIRVVPAGPKPWSVFRVPGLAAASRPDLISAQDPFLAGLAAWLAARRTGAKLQLQIHADILNPRFRKGLANIFRVLLARFLLPKAHSLRAVSRRVAGSVAYLKKPTSVLPVFVDLETIRQAPAADLKGKYGFKTLILMAGRFSQEKNILLALQALKDIPKDSGMGMAIVGDGPEKSRYLEYIQVNGVDGRVVIEPWTDQLPSWYKGADIYLLTSDHEGYSRTVAEAMAAGCPVIMTDVGLAGETVRDGENGVVVPVGDAQAVAAALVKLAGNPELRAKLADAAQKTAASLPSREEYREQFKHSFAL